MGRASVAPLAVGGIVALAACGFSGAGTGPAADSDATAPDGSSVGEGGPADGGSGVDAPTVDPRPSHVPEVGFDLSAADVAGLTEIDTASLSTTPVLPAGAHLEVRGGSKLAVLFVGAWNVDVPLVVRGSRGLVVVAARAVRITASIDAGAKGVVPGPGGFALGTGDGKGNDGKPGSGNDDSGGGGGSFGGPGAAGGDSSATVTGGDPGKPYGDDPNLFLGGSPGGEGSEAGKCRPFGQGGGGGGAIQISSRLSIDVSTNGWINAGGGGGRGGCRSEGKAGGGGGSGGTIFLEAPSLVIAGVLAANGGGGGAGGEGDPFGFDGESGDDAGKNLPNLTAAVGGDDPAQGKGGAGAIELTPAVKPAASGNTNEGGGGGGLGRIWLHGYGGKAPIVTGARISPAHKIVP